MSCALSHKQRGKGLAQARSLSSSAESRNHVEPGSLDVSINPWVRLSRA